MTESATLARPYAQAVFRLAREEKSLAKWSGRLRRLAMIADDPRMAELIGNPKFSAGEIAELFMALSGEPGNRELASFVAQLAENGRFDVLAEIGAIFESLKNADEGVEEARVESAFPIDEPALSALMKRLEVHFGGRLRGRVVLKPSLIGGVRVAVGDRIFDASVRGKLDAMAAALKN
jgi:F-type H+-transporting ATPase subunit delta